MDEQAEKELQQFYRMAETKLCQYWGKDHGRKLYFIGQHLPEVQDRLEYYKAVLQDSERKIKGLPLEYLPMMATYKRPPVGIDEFIRSPLYLNKADEVYPKVLEELIEINTGKYQEVVFTGGIGSAKTTCALYTTAYQLYLLSCLWEPHKIFGLDSVSEILLVFQSLNAKTAKNSFERFKGLIESSPYFQTHFMFNRDLTSKLVFPHRLEVVPVSGQETAVIGQNVIGGMIDELNYMQVVEKSKQSVDQGQYDQAVALYNSIARRRKSRFLQQGKMPGVLCLVSSKRYPGQFTDLKEEEAKTDPTIYVYDYRVWEIKPPGSFGEKRFAVFCGTETNKPRILKDDEEPSEQERPHIKLIPEEFRTDFKKDIINALREIAGVSTLARHPFFLDVERVNACFGKLPMIVSREVVDFEETKLQIYPGRFRNPELPRYAHVDLAITGDSAGVAIGHCPGFKSMFELGYSRNKEEYMPMIDYDLILEVRPPLNGEILFYKIREVLTTLRELGMNIRWVSFDSFQSTDSLQLLRAQGFIVGTVSMDTEVTPYETLKSGMYTGLVRAPAHAKAKKEIISLEKDTKTGKIDHPPNGSKDCSDAMAGVAYGLSTRREVWAMYGIPVVSMPPSLSKRAEKDAKNERERPTDIRRHNAGSPSVVA